MLKNKWVYLFSSNFLGVFNDNFLKYCVIFISVRWILPDWLTESQLISMVSACLVIPYVLISPVGGKWAVRYSKLKIFRTMKAAEIGVVFIAGVAFYYQWLWLAVGSVLLLGIQSCLYSPSKYGLIRDIGGVEGSSFGSGMFETMAFLGILSGTFIASVVSDHYSFPLQFSILLFVAVLGYVVTKSIKANELPIEQGETDTTNPVKFIRNMYKYSKFHTLVNSAVFGASSFWLLGAVLQMNIVIHCKNILHVSNSVTGAIMAIAAIGIGIGTAFTGKISKNKARKELILVSLAGMIICLLVLLIFRFTVVPFSIVIVFFAFFGGMLQTPSLTIIQQSDLGRKIGDVIAYLNIVTFAFILTGTLIFSVSTALSGENSYVVFGVMAFLSVLILMYFLLRYPDFRNELKIKLKK